MKGRVKWWNTKEGYGFIEYEDQNIFAHIKKEMGKEILIEDDQEIEFETIDTKEGLFIKIFKPIEQNA